jgi:hypothetical protein
MTFMIQFAQPKLFPAIHGVFQAVRWYMDARKCGFSPTALFMGVVAPRFKQQIMRF